MKGRKPVPTALKVLRGNPGKRALPKDEPTAPLLDPSSPPSELSEAAIAEWHKWAPRLSAAGLLTELDEIALVNLCETRVMLREARASGEVSRVLKLQDAANKLLVEFGMTPSSRTRVSKSATPKKPANRFAELAG